MIRRIDRSVLLSAMLIGMGSMMFAFAPPLIPSQALASDGCHAEGGSMACENLGLVCCGDVCVDGVTVCCCDGNVVECAEAD